eukprot:TRINITY_DN3250_c2_g1_i1.p2 TRINITY_DN3250_c2_g1~~TRINITY_DN3250_c2_g1_i1.p2  ORF type:complete len:278 (+),score=83.58 TRINITY_DN3250_c2_g1_i1:55-888(+)
MNDIMLSNNYLDSPIVLEEFEHDEDFYARKIQKVWQSFLDKEIFRFYKDLIVFKEGGDPLTLMKIINPREALLLDRASQHKIQFRLGGTTFPPSIYYKVTINSSVCDVNDFAPRDYANINKDPNADPEQGWYERTGIAGWKKVNSSLLTQYIGFLGLNNPFIPLEKPVEKTYTYKKKILSNEEKKKRFMQKKRGEWFAKMLEKTSNAPSVKDDDVSMEEEEELINWAETLDFDSYALDWTNLGSSLPMGYDLLPDHVLEQFLSEDEENEEDDVYDDL